MTRIAGLVAALTCIIAGIYMISIQTAGQNSVFEAMAHGIGIYFIGKGIFVGAVLWKAQYEAEQTARRFEPGETE